MKANEMKRQIIEYCQSRKCNSGKRNECPLYRDGFSPCFSTDNDEIIKKNYQILIDHHAIQEQFPNENVITITIGEWNV